MLNPKARPSTTASWFFETRAARRAKRAGGDRLSRAGIVSLLVHLLLITLVIWQPRLYVPLQPAEIPAELELNLGSGATHDGAPPPASPQQAQPADKPSPPAPKAAPVKDQPKEAGDLPQPKPPSPAPPTPQTTPAPPSPQPVQQSVASPKTDINLGDGFTAPPAEYDNPIEHVDAAADPNNVAPVYPREAAQRGEEGDVVVQMYIDASGKVANLDVVQSSGSSSLDQATIDAVSRWHFRPAFHNGVAVPSVRMQLVRYGRK